MQLSRYKGMAAWEVQRKLPSECVGLVLSGNEAEIEVAKLVESHGAKAGAYYTAAVLFFSSGTVERSMEECVYLLRDLSERVKKEESKRFFKCAAFNLSSGIVWCRASPKFDNPPFRKREWPLRMRPKTGEMISLANFLLLLILRNNYLTWDSLTTTEKIAINSVGTTLNDIMKFVKKSEKSCRKSKHLPYRKSER